MICTFERGPAHYAYITSDPEYILMKRNTETGVLSEFTLWHGPDNILQILNKSELSVIIQDGNYHEVNLRITTQEYDDTGEPPNSLKGKIMANKHSPLKNAALFAAIW